MSDNVSRESVTEMFGEHFTWGDYKHFSPVEFNHTVERVDARQPIEQLRGVIASLPAAPPSPVDAAARALADVAITVADQDKSEASDGEWGKWNDDHVKLGVAYRAALTAYRLARCEG